MSYKKTVEEGLKEAESWSFDFAKTGGMYLSPDTVVLKPKDYIKSFLTTFAKKIHSQAIETYKETFEQQTKALKEQFQEGVKIERERICGILKGMRIKDWYSDDEFSFNKALSDSITAIKRENV